MPAISLLAVGGAGAWSHDLACARQKGSESFQDVSVVHLDDDFRGGVVAGDRVKPNWVLSTLVSKSPWRSLSPHLLLASRRVWRTLKHTEGDSARSWKPNTLAGFPKSAGLLCTTSQCEVGRVPVIGLGESELEDWGAMPQPPSIHLLCQVLIIWVEVSLCRDEETEAHDVVAFGEISCLVVK